MIETETGRWNTQKARDVAASSAAVWFGIPRRAYSLMHGNRCLATVRRANDQGMWFVRVEGWEWRATPEMRFSKIMPGVRFTPVFPSKGSTAGKAEAERVLRSACAQVL